MLGYAANVAMLNLDLGKNNILKCMLIVLALLACSCVSSPQPAKIIQPSILRLWANHPTQWNDTVFHQIFPLAEPQWSYDDRPKENP